MTLPRRRLLRLPLLGVLLLTGGAAFAASTYSDRVGDVKGGKGPDIGSLRVSNTKTGVTFRIRFAKAPPLGVDARGQWIDMLLVGVDVPPFGPPPVAPGAQWPGANFAAGTHGPSKTGLLVRLSRGTSRPVARLKIVTSGSTLTFTISRQALGSPASFRFTVAAAREGNRADAGGGVDVAPARGTFRYVLAG